MGFEPTTASLEGWNSTTELRPPDDFVCPAAITTRTYCAAILPVIHISPTGLNLVGRQGFEPWKT